MDPTYYFRVAHRPIVAELYNHYCASNSVDYSLPLLLNLTFFTGSMLCTTGLAISSIPIDRNEMLQNVFLGLGGIAFSAVSVLSYAVRCLAVYHFLTHTLVDDIFVPIGVEIADW